MQVDWIAAVVPWGGTYKPLWMGLGAVASDLIVALILTSILRARMRLGTWRAIHWLAYAAWPIAVIHGIGAGTDLRSGPLLWLTLALTGSVALAGTWRIATALTRAPRAARVARRLPAAGHNVAAQYPTTAGRTR